MGRAYCVLLCYIRTDTPKSKKKKKKTLKHLSKVIAPHQYVTTSTPTSHIERDHFMPRHLRIDHAQVSPFVRCLDVRNLQVPFRIRGTDHVKAAVVDLAHILHGQKRVPSGAVGSALLLLPYHLLH